MKSQKNLRRDQRKNRIRSRISGDNKTPRLSVFKSCSSLYAQLIDDTKDMTLVSISSMKEKKCNKEIAKDLGIKMAKKIKTAKISACKFDRNGYKYHGVIKEFADAMRSEGVKF